MACQYNALTIASLNASQGGISVSADFLNEADNFKVLYIPLSLSLTPSFNANTTTQLALSLDINLQANVSETVPLEACLFYQPLS